jgi:hypothetical protein
MKDSELLAAVAAFVAVDIIINAAWMGSEGMKSIEIVTDPDRPAYNYLTCDFGPAEGAIFAHLAVKGGVLLLGVALTWAVRNTPSQFNESTLIGLSIYNVSFVIAFIVPIIAVGLGGRRTVYLIRAYAIMFVVLTTLGLLYIPKLLNLADGGNTVVRANMTANASHISPKPGAGTRSDSGGGSSPMPAKSSPGASGEEGVRTINVAPSPDKSQKYVPIELNTIGEDTV